MFTLSKTYKNSLDSTDISVIASKEYNKLDSLVGVNYIKAKELIIVDPNSNNNTPIKISADGISGISLPTDDNTKLPLEGGAMKGEIDFGGYEALNSKDPTSSTSLTTKNYVDNAIIAAGSSSSLNIKYITSDTILESFTNNYIFAAANLNLLLPAAPKHNDYLEIIDANYSFVNNIVNISVNNPNHYINNKTNNIRLSNTHCIHRFLYNDKEVKKNWIYTLSSDSYNNYNIFIDASNNNPAINGNIINLELGYNYYINSVGMQPQLQLPFIYGINDNNINYINITDINSSFKESPCVLLAAKNNYIYIPGDDKNFYSEYTLNRNNQVVEIIIINDNSWLIDDSSSIPFNYLPKSGGSMNGNIDMSDNSIVKVNRLNKKLNVITSTLKNETIVLTKDSSELIHVQDVNEILRIYLPDTKTLTIGHTFTITTSDLINSPKSVIIFPYNADIVSTITAVNKISNETIDNAIEYINDNEESKLRYSGEIKLNDPKYNWYNNKAKVSNSPADFNYFIDQDTNLVAGYKYHVDTTNGSINCTLPETPVNGDTITIIDLKNKFKLNPVLLICAPGISIAEENKNNYIANNCGNVFDLIYDSVTKMWVITNTIMKGASYLAAGDTGLVPAPDITSYNAVLTGASKWSNIPITNYKEIKFGDVVDIKYSIHYGVDTTNDVISVTLPATSTVPDSASIQFTDISGKFDTNSFTVLTDVSSGDNIINGDNIATIKSIVFNIKNTSVIFTKVKNLWYLLQLSSNNYNDLLSKSGGNMTGDINMMQNIITNLHDPTNSTDAATKNYVDTSITAAKLNNGSTKLAANLDINLFKLVNNAEPTNASDAATKNYVDNSLAVVNSAKLNVDGSNKMLANLDAGDFKVINLLNPSNSKDAATKDYVDTSINNAKLNLGGNITLNSDLDCNNYKLINLKNPTAALDAATKDYVDTSDALKLSINGTNKMLSTLDFNTNKGINLLDPTAATDAANKNYVDTTLTALSEKKLNIDGTNKMTSNLDLNGYTCVNLVEPINNKDAVTKNYVDTGLSTLSNIKLDVDGFNKMLGNLNFNGYTGVNLIDPVNSSDIATKKYTDSSLALLSIAKLNLDGTSKMTGNLDFNLNKGINLSDPTNTTDAANKKYVDNNLTALNLTKLNLDGTSKMTGNLDFNLNKGINLANPTNSTDATNKSYVDSNLSVFSAVKLDLNGANKMLANLDFNSNKGINLSDPTALTDAANKKYVDTKLSLDGTNKMLANLDFNSNKGINLSDPTALTDAANKKYVDTKLSLDGTNKMLANLDFNSNKGINLSDPTALTDAANKKYVDTKLSLDGTNKMLANLDFGNKRGINVSNPIDLTDVVNKQYLDIILNSITSSNAKKVKYISDKTYPGYCFGCITSDDSIMTHGNFGANLYMNSTIADIAHLPCYHTTNGVKTGLWCGIRQTYTSLYCWTTTGEIWCGGANTSGSLALGDTLFRSVLTKCNSPTWPSTNTVVDLIVCGANSINQTVYLLNNLGEVWGAGANNTGGLATNDTVNRNTWTIITGFTGKAVKIAAVNNNTAQALYIITDADTRNLWVCGSNASGNLGDGTTINRLALFNINEDVKDIIAYGVGLGLSMGASILTKNGQIKSCGENHIGQLGIGILSPSVNVFTQEALLKNNWISMGGNLDASNGYRWAIDSTGGFYRWGYNLNYCLGTGDTDTSSKSTPVMLTNLPWGSANIVKVESGYSYEATITIVLTDDGNLWHCGRSTNYEKGSYDTTPNAIFKLIPRPANGIKWINFVIVGETNLTHIHAVTENYDLYNWGYKAYGSCAGQVSGSSVFTPTLVIL